MLGGGGGAGGAAGPELDIAVYTTRPETVFGATFLAVAPTHPVFAAVPVEQPQADAIAGLADVAAKAAVDEQIGVEHAVDSGLRAVNPFTGEPVPVYAAAYVLGHYGTGAVMGVPAHDSRDWDLAHAQGLAVKPVLAPAPVAGAGGAASAEPALPYTGFTGDEAMLDSGGFTGMPAGEARRAISSDAAQRGFGDAVTATKMRDWGISRQRYWGTPIPMIACEHCGDVPVPEEDLPVVLPQVRADTKLMGGSGAPLSTIAEWVNVPCPTCQAPAQRCTDTMDTFVDSSWYYLRYLDAQNEAELCGAEASKGMPVDIYVGGIEHAVMHLLYARFMCHVMRDLGLTDGHDEPFVRLLTQGMVHGKTYTSPATGKILKPAEVVRNEAGDLMQAANDEPVDVVWAKMSKSKHNGVDPQLIVDKHVVANAANYCPNVRVVPGVVLAWPHSRLVGVSAAKATKTGLTAKFTRNPETGRLLPGTVRTRRGCSCCSKHPPTPSSSGTLTLSTASTAGSTACGPPYTMLPGHRAGTPRARPAPPHPPRRQGLTMQKSARCSSPRTRPSQASRRR